MPNSPQCPECHTPLPADTPEGLCPVCHLRALLANPPATPDALTSSLVTHHSPLGLPGHFGDYELLEEIGHGGMGVVFKARQKSLDRTVAVKMLLPGAASHPDYLNRFRTEASAAAGLQHPNIVAIHEVGVHEGRPFLVMDYVEGRSLARWISNLKSQISDPHQAAQWMQTVAEAIQFAHDHGILHRDLKPSNILIDTSGQPRLTDFGLAKRLIGDTSLTLSGQLLGSPSYMPPEQAAARHGKVSRRSDVYGLGATLYHLLTGRAPFQAATITETLDEVLNKEPVAPRVLSSGIPRDLDTICLKCLEKDPHRRYASARELADELGRFLRGEPTLARPVGFVDKTAKWCRRRPALAALSGALAIALVLGTAGVLWQWRQSEAQRARAEAGERLAAQRAYDSDINLAQRALADLNLGRARELLDRHRPSTDSAFRTPRSAFDPRGWEWRYLWKQTRGDRSQVLTNCSNMIMSMAISSDGRRLAIRERSGRITLWDMTVRRQVGELPDGEPPGRGWHRALAITARGDLLAAGGNEPTEAGIRRGVVRFWDLHTLKVIPQPVVHFNGLQCLAMSPDGRWLATHGDDRKLRLWDLERRQEITNYDTGDLEPSRREGYLAFSPGSERLAFGDTLKNKGLTSLLDLRTGERTDLPPHEGSGVTALAFSPDGRRLAAGYGYRDTTNRLWDVQSKQLIHQLKGHSTWVSCVAFMPEGKILVSGAEDQTVRLWDVESGRLVRTLLGHASAVMALVVLPDGKGLVSGDDDGTVRIWDLNDPPPDPGPVVVPVNPQFWNTPFAFLPDSRSFVALDPDGSVVVRNTVTGREEERITALGTNRLGLALSPDSRLIAVGATKGLLSVWDRAQQRLLANTTVHTGEVRSVSFGEQGRILRLELQSAGDACDVKLWDTHTWREARPYSLKFTNVSCLVWSPDDRLAALGDWGGDVTWWDAATGQTLAVLHGIHRYAAFSGAFSPDGRLLATASQDNRVVLWDTRTRQAIREPLRGHRMGIYSVAFSPDGRRLATGGMYPEDAIKLWNVETGAELATLRAPTGCPQRLAFSPDGNTLAAVSTVFAEEYWLYLWHAPSWEEIAAAEQDQAAQPAVR
jgi:WD40 repeat protein/serine/threonine protein kinase